MGGLTTNEIAAFVILALLLALLYQTAETLTHLHHRPRPSKPPISHWTTVRFLQWMSQWRRT